MAQTIPSVSVSTPRNSLDRVQPRPAKAALAVNASQCAMSAIVKDALIRHYGSLKSAAISMGQMDQGQLTRDLDSGKFKLERLELCDDEAKAFITSALFAAFGSLDPKARAQRLVREARQRLDELMEALSA